MMVFRQFATIPLSCLLATQVTAGPHYHYQHRAPHWQGHTVPYAYHFPARHSCWCWRGGVWVWGPLANVQVGDAVYFQGYVGTWRIVAPPVIGGAGISLGLEAWR
jgi:hypothetical protein